MQMKKVLIILFIFSFFFPLSAIKAQTTSNAGFVSSNNIWYSKDPFQEGDKVGIYTLVFNPDSRPLSGTVVFFDNQLVLGTKDFNVTANGVVEIHINWIATVGEHVIFGRIENSRFLTSDGKYEDAYLVENETTKSSRTIEAKVVPSIPETTTSIGTNTKANSNNPNPNTSSSASGFIQNVGNAVAENTPTFIKQPVSSASNVSEKFIQSSGSSLENKKQEISKEIKALDPSKGTTAKETSQNKLEKPFKYVGLFFYTLASYIFNSKFLFYGILILLVFFLLRFIWRKIHPKRY